MFERYNVADERDKLKALRDARAYTESCESNSPDARKIAARSGRAPAARASRAASRSTRPCVGVSGSLTNDDTDKNTDTSTLILRVPAYVLGISGQDAGIRTPVFAIRF